MKCYLEKIESKYVQTSKQDAVSCLLLYILLY